MPLIQTGIQAAAGAIGKGKEQKAEAKAPEGMPQAGAEKAAPAQPQPPPGAEQIDRFLQMLNGPNIRSIGDIKNLRDEVLKKIATLAPDQQDNAKKKLNQAIVQKLGIAQPGPNGSLTVNLTPQNQQLLQALGLQPDQVAPAGAAGPAGPAGPAAPAGAAGATGQNGAANLTNVPPMPLG